MRWQEPAPPKQHRRQFAFTSRRTEPPARVNAEGQSTVEWILVRRRPLTRRVDLIHYRESAALQHHSKPT